MTTYSGFQSLSYAINSLSSWATRALQPTHPILTSSVKIGSCGSLYFANISLLRFVSYFPLPAIQIQNCLQSPSHPSIHDVFRTHYTLQEIPFPSNSLSVVAFENYKSANLCIYNELVSEFMLYWLFLPLFLP